MASSSIKTITSFSGADLIVNFGPVVIGELQSISYGIQREKAPVYTLGSPDPRSFSRGKRGIAGQLAFAMFDRDALIAELTKEANWNSIAPPAMFTAAGNIASRGSEDFSNLLSMAGWNDTVSTLATTPASGSTDVVPTTNIAINGTGVDINVPPGFALIQSGNILYADMLPPFDITMTFANEYGQAAFQRIYDIDILNDGSGVSVDSIVMERHMTFIARRLSPLTSGVFTRSDTGVTSGTAVY